MGKRYNDKNIMDKQFRLLKTDWEKFQSVFFAYRHVF